MTVPRSLHSDETIACNSPAGQVLAGEVIARFLVRLSRHRRVMRIARRVHFKREGERA